MANTYVTETLKNAVFSDGSILSGTFTAEYNASGGLIAIVNPSFIITPTSGVATSFTSAKVATTSGSFELTAATGSNTTYSNLNIDWSGETPTTLNATSGTAATTVTNSVGTVLSLTGTGTVTSVTDQSITTSISGAAFADGATLSGTWTATYDPNGFLLAIQSASFTVTGPGGTNSFTSMGTLPYADDPTASGFTSYEMHSLSTTGTGSYNSLYVDWKTENPSSFYEGSPSLFTSIKNSSSATPTSSIRLISDGSSGTGSTPVITGLSSTESGTDTTVVVPFAGAAVTDTDPATSATIVLNVGGVASDANGVLSGANLTETAAGTYSLVVTTPANLTSELQALKFTPTIGEVLSGKTVSTRIDLAINDTDGSTSASTVLTETATCFLRGTLIATPSGEVAVETLGAGDMVSVLKDGAWVGRPIAWTGRGRMEAARFGHRDEAFPVRIRADAFAAGQPSRDLLVTQEHCILTDAGLTPARMLVNGASILIDRSLPEYDFFHVELGCHGILSSQGLTTESYLDTGNRAVFAGAGEGVPGDRGLAMAAPLAVARALVEPIWNHLAARARALGLDDGNPVRTITDQPGLRLLLECGTELAACWHDAQRHMFRIPRDARPVRLLSRAAVPAEAIGPFVDDRRRLGVAVDRLVLWSGLNATVVPAARLALEGWHRPEGTHRWTNGNAALDLPRADADTYLDVHVSATLPYAEALAG